MPPAEDPAGVRRRTGGGAAVDRLLVSPAGRGGPPTGLDAAALQSGHGGRDRHAHQRGHHRQPQLRAGAQGDDPEAAGDHGSAGLPLRREALLGRADAGGASAHPVGTLYRRRHPVAVPGRGPLAAVRALHPDLLGGVHDGLRPAAGPVPALCQSGRCAGVRHRGELSRDFGSPGSTGSGRRRRMWRSCACGRRCSWWWAGRCLCGRRCEGCCCVV